MGYYVLVIGAGGAVGQMANHKCRCPIKPLDSVQHGIVEAVSYETASEDSGEVSDNACQPASPR